MEKFYYLGAFNHFPSTREEVVGLLGVLRLTSVGASTDSETNDGPGA